MSVGFLLTSLIVVVTPGTGVLYVMAAGISRGGRASVIASVGCTLGIVPHMLAAITGLAALLNTSAVAFQILKYVGVAYLLFMAWSTLRDKDALAVKEDTEHRTVRTVIVRGILINVLNPKLAVFFFAFLPQFVSSTESDSFLHLIELSAVFMLLTFIVFIGYGRFAASIRNHVISRPEVLAWIRRVFAGAFVTLGVSLLAFNNG
jgi:threonine/homoserine/homoserine lactone efflux protein